MKNVKIGLKLLISFSILVALLLAVSIIGVVGMYLINNADTELYTDNLLAIDYVGTMNSELNKQRMLIRQFVIFDPGDKEFDGAHTELSDSERTMTQMIDLYELTIATQYEREIFDKYKTQYNSDWALCKSSIIDSATHEGYDAALANLQKYNTIGNDIMATLSIISELNVEYSKEKLDSNSQLFINMVLAFIALLIVSIVAAVFLGTYLSKTIRVPMQFLSNFLGELAATGNLDLVKQKSAELQQLMQQRDETGEAVNAVSRFVALVEEQGSMLRKIANKDLTSNVVMHSEDCTIDVIAREMLDQLNDVMSGIQESANLVSSGSKQVSNGSQALAQGATQQAAAVEELLSSISDVASKTKENASKAEKAADLADSIKDSAEKGSEQMNNMMQAVEEINEASRNINKVIKVIDNIAFQTDILALNATVEAARAGNEGRGFAVVADEVRRLATQSADAVKDTGSLIANSMEKARLGAQIAAETVASLQKIVSGINESTVVVREIALASNEQSAAISQINTGIDQVAQVVQQNSSTSQESAAASMEMANQADILAKLSSQFRLRGRSNSGSSAYGSSSYGSSSYNPKPRRESRQESADNDLFTLPAPSSGSSDIKNSDNFGKY